MRLKSVRLKNYRGYRDSGWIELGPLTAFIGENDSGKSTILEALDLFFNDNDAACPFSPDDISKGVAEGENAEIRCVFSLIGVQRRSSSNDILEEGAASLLNENGMLEIAKRFSVEDGKTVSKTVMIRAARIDVPVGTRSKSLQNCSRDDLLKAKSALKIRSSSRKESLLRLAVFRHCVGIHECNKSFDDLVVGKRGDVSSEIWNALRDLLPSYHLFRADRENSDSEDEIQDPIKQVVRTCLAKPAMRKRLDAIASSVKKELVPVVSSTLRYVHELDSNALKNLTPRIPEIGSAKWADAFKGVALASDGDIPLNRRGSGIKRMVLVGFFRAKAEAVDKHSDNVVYAVEEPETGQHFDHQRDLAESFLDLSKKSGVQVLLTTHSPVFVSRLSHDAVLKVSKSSTGVHADKILDCVLPNPSMNEINYLAFGECREAYLNELYGHVESFVENGKSDLKNGRSDAVIKSWTRSDKPLGKDNPEKFTIAYYIRNYIHHPENALNSKPTDPEWIEAIRYLRSLISHQQNNPNRKDLT